MFKNIFKHILLPVAVGITALLSVSCGEYQAVLKSTDNDFIYNKALKYYAAGDYEKATTLFGRVVNSYTGTTRADTIIVLYAKSLSEIGDYYTAAHYFKNYVKTFPSSDNCEECQFLCGYCYYNLSPKYLLDQQDTQTAIDELQTFLNLYPHSSHADEAEQMLKEMQDKIAYKAYMNAKLYFNLGNYLGNNYKSAIIVAQNCLKNYPDTKHREELSFLILESKYIQAENSVLQKQSERYRDTIDEYYSFINEFPNSKYLNKAAKMLASSEHGLRKAEELLPPSADDLDYYRNFGTRAEQELKHILETQNQQPKE